MGFLLASDAVDQTGINVSGGYLRIVSVLVDKAALAIKIDYEIYSTHQRRIDCDPPSIVDRHVAYAGEEFSALVDDQIGISWPSAYAALRSNPLTAAMLAGATVV